MKRIWTAILPFVIFSCKKENPGTITPSPYAANKIEGNIYWPGSTTHFINKPSSGQSIYAYFELNITGWLAGESYITMTGYSSDTILTIAILNTSLKIPAVYDFQILDSNHYVSVNLQTGYEKGPSPVAYFRGISYCNKGKLSIDSISEKHISGSIDAYCNQIFRGGSIKDTSQTRLIFHFSGNLHSD